MKKRTGPQTAESVLECGFEGGKLTIVRIRNGTGPWRFQVECNEALTFDMLDPEDQAGLAPITRSRLFGTFEEAIEAIDQYPWTCHVPLSVQEEYREAVWRAYRLKTARGTDSSWEERHRDRWQSACGVEPNQDRTPNAD